MLCCASLTTRCVLNCQKIRNCISCGIDTNIDAKQIMEHIRIVNMINIHDFDPFNQWTTASLHSKTFSAFKLGYFELIFYLEFMELDYNFHALKPHNTQYTGIKFAVESSKLIKT